ncbi:MAG: diphthine--ammonia ligase [Dehalococcoidales bacterium]
MESVFVSWSGGKDCCLACYRAIESGLDVRYLASMMTEHTRRLWPHHLKPEILRLQAEAIGIPLLLNVTTVTHYNDKFKDMLRAFRKEGISGGVFGDVSISNGLADKHKKWVDDVCQPEGINPHRPLWAQGREELIRDLIEQGFEAIIIAAERRRLGKELVGRVMDKDLMLELKRRSELSPNGEVGIYHTFVTNGPLFKKRLELAETRKVLIGNYWYLDIVKGHLIDKTPDDMKTTHTMEACLTR